jgi:hypothetical protein
MAQTGVLDYQRYLNTLQTLNDLGQTFPSNQQTYNFSITGSTTSSWTATVSWETLILDKVSYSSKSSGYVPNVDNSQVIGYFEGSTTTQYSTGVISIPANMYTGPILPGGDFHVPLTVVHLSWFDGTTRYAQQIGFIQNWEPGVEIGDPTLDFNYFPVYSIPSTLTLTGDTGIVYGDNLTLTATTDMSIDLGVNATRVRFYRVSTGTDVVLGTSYFTGTVATLVLPTNPSLPIGTYNIYAVSQPRGIYRSATSNTLNVRVEAGVPLIVTTSTFTPSQSYYYPGHTVNYRLGVIADPAFTATGVAIANPISIKLVDAFTPFTETNILSGNFIAGQTNTNFTVQSSMIDVARTYPQTTWNITTSSQSSTRYTATIFVSNTETVSSSWGYQTLGRYRAGSTSTTINVATSTSVTVVGQAFPLTITQSSTSTYYDEGFSITVGTTTATYYTNISLIANNGTTSTTLYSGNNSGAGIFTVTNIIIATTGTWTITASYPGDLGQSLVNANLPSTSNTLTHIVRLGNDLLPTPIVTLDKISGREIVRVSATTSTTLTNTVTFLYNVTNLDTSSWSRQTLVAIDTTSTVKSGSMNIASGGMDRNFDSNKNTRNFNGWYNTTATWDIRTTATIKTLTYNRTWKWMNLSTEGPYFPWFSGNPQVVRINLNNVPIKLKVNIDYASYGNYLEWSDELRYQVRDGSKFIIYNDTINQTSGDQSGKLVNAFRLFKYYNGSNYNLSAVTGTNINEILDPITTGTTWSADFIGTETTTTKEYLLPSVIYAPVNSAPLGTPAGAGTLSRLYDYEQDGSVQVETYDIYKTDTIGTADGYNVIGLASDFYGDRTTAMTTSSPTRLYFQVPPYTSNVTGTRYNVSYAYDQTNYLTRTSLNPVKTRYIDLVKYIGEVEWTKPIENDAQAAGTQARSTIKVKLFQFTPTIPQANTQFKNSFGGSAKHLDLPDPITTSTYTNGTTIPNGGFRIVKFSTSLNRSQNTIKGSEFFNTPGLPCLPQVNGQYYTTFAWIDNWQNPTTGAVNKNAYKLNGKSKITGGTPDSDVENQRYTNYGVKYWASTNPGNAAADNLAEFYNEWFQTFGWGWTDRSTNATKIFFDPDYSTSTAYISTSSRQIATINLPGGTIPSGDITTTLHARWPGTLALPLEYGRYNSFDIYASSTSTRPALDYLVVGGGGAGGILYGGNGGGAGGVITGTTSIIFGKQYEISIGAGGLSRANKYGYSNTQTQTISTINYVYSGPLPGNPTTFDDITAQGGGWGAHNIFNTNIDPYMPPSSGGSGGGGNPPGDGIAGQGNAGGTGAGDATSGFGGGGGGGGQVGGNGGDYDAGGRGGNGIQWFDGNYYGGGGGGSSARRYGIYTPYFSGWVNLPGGQGGLGGGGRGGDYNGNGSGTAGAPNTGGGGGGGMGNNNGSAGGSGVVIVRTLKSLPLATSYNATVTEVGNYRYYKWTSKGSIIF